MSAETTEHKAEATCTNAKTTVQCG